MKHAAAVAGSVQQLLTGSTEPDPGQHGLTTDEERAASRNLQVGHLLYGCIYMQVAAYERPAY